MRAADGGTVTRSAHVLGGDSALAWRAPGGPSRPPYQWRRLSLRARAPEQSSGTPSRGISTGVLRRSLRSSTVTALTSGCHASCTRGACMSLGPPTGWGRMSEGHVHWAPSDAVMAIAPRSAAGSRHEGTVTSMWGESGGTEWADGRPSTSEPALTRI